MDCMVLHVIEKYTALCLKIVNRRVACKQINHSR